MVRVFGEIKEPSLFLKLVQEGSRVCLILVDKDGDKHGSGNVLTIGESGISFHSSITHAAPFKLNREGEIFNLDKDC